MAENGHTVPGPLKVPPLFHNHVMGTADIKHFNEYYTECHLTDIMDNFFRNLSFRT